MSRRLLLVDDDAETLEHMRALFAARGYTVQTAGNGAEGLSALIADPEDEPALVVLDVNMPVMDGLQLAALMRSYTRFSGIPVVLVTASEVPAEATPAFAAILRKPVDAAVLVEIVHRICNPAHRAEG